MNNLPHFKTIEILKKLTNGSIHRIEFKDCSMMITGNHLIIITNQYDKSKYNNLTNHEWLVSTTGDIFNLSEIKAYKTT
jgi:hypothetical protein